MAGIVAQLFQKSPSATPAEVEEAITSTAYKYGYGAPYVGTRRSTRDTARWTSWPRPTPFPDLILGKATSATFSGSCGGCGRGPRPRTPGCRRRRARPARRGRPWSGAGR
ncbi:MAG: hypothetical protein ACXWDM_00425 [Nocardioides sp.]